MFDSVWGGGNTAPLERNTAWNKGRKCFHCLGAPNNLIRPWAPGTVWTIAENLDHTGFRSPDLSARSESLYWPYFVVSTVFKLPTILKVLQCRATQHASTFPPSTQKDPCCILFSSLSTKDGEWIIKWTTSKKTVILEGKQKTRFAHCRVVACWYRERRCFGDEGHPTPWGSRLLKAALASAGTRRAVADGIHTVW